MFETQVQYKPQASVIKVYQYISVDVGKFSGSISELV